MLSEKEVSVLKEQINKALSDSGVNGWEMSFLGSIYENIIKYGLKTTISDKQRYRMDQIFAKTNVHRDPCADEIKRRIQGDPDWPFY